VDPDALSFVTLALTPSQVRAIRRATGVEIHALKVTPELALERAIESSKVRHIRACEVSWVDGHESR
jgi:hypothetical protein